MSKQEPKVWIIRAGKHGEYELFALENNCVVIHWKQLEDINNMSLDDIKKTGQQHGLSAQEIINFSLQPDHFARSIQKEDLVIIPSKINPGYVAVGRVIGDYEYEPDGDEGTKHRRSVKWLDKEFPKVRFPSDISSALARPLTVYAIKKENCFREIQSLLKSENTTQADIPLEKTEDEYLLDSQELAQNTIRKHIQQTFQGYEMQKLIAGLLKAMGFHTIVPNKGADKGIDVLAANGELGFESPFVCVQVKNRPRDKTGDAELRDLQGTMKNTGSEKGIFVSWGGFSNETKMRINYFSSIRLWNSDDVMELIYKHYHQLPNDIKEKLRLKQIWIIDRQE